ncbi:MAG: discoidin domain-containing protein [Clostridia bacterium]|nr:discoidin domain-containing protein [Clostridia bacterium]
MKKITKILSLMLALTVLSSSFGTVVFAKDEPTIYFNEAFDNYPTNDKTGKLNIDRGTDGRVVIRKEGTLQKAAYAKASRSAVLLTAPFGEHSESFVVSADIMIDGATTKGNVMELSGSSSLPLLKYEANGSVLLGDNYRLGSYRLGEWKTYTFVISKAKQKFSLYINGKAAVENWYFTSKLAGENTLKFGISKPANAEYSELYVDNVRVYSGDRVLKNSDFPKVKANPAEYPFEPAGPVEIGNTVFLNTTGDKGFTPQLAGKTGVAEFAPLPDSDDEEKVHLHLKRDAGVNTDVFADITLGSTENVTHFVYELSVYPNEISSSYASSMLAAMVSYSNKNTALMRLFGDGNVKYGDTLTYAKIPLKEWSHIAIAVKLDAQTADFYLNGELKASDVPIVMDAPQKIRVSLVVGDYAMDMYYDNFRFYEGSAPRDISNEESSQAGSLIAVGEHKEDADQAMGEGSAAFMTAKDFVYYNGSKTPYSSLGNAPKMIGDVFCTDINTLKAVFGAEVSYSEADGKIDVNGAEMTVGSNAVSVDGKALTLDAAPVAENGAVYVPLASVAEVALKKFVYKDGRGWILVSNVNRGLSNSGNTAEYTEKSDVIDRFLQFDRPTGDALYSAIINTVGEKQHPRLFATADQIADLRENIKTNPVMAKWARVNLSGADALINREPVEYNIPDGLRLFLACLEVRERLYSYAVAYMISGDRKYADGAWKEVENACNWKDWNTGKHYLDSGKIGPGMALAYDVFYHEFTEEQKAFMRQKVRQHWLDYTAGAYTGTNAHKNMLVNGSNWGSVCNGAVLMWSLATMDEEPADSEYTELVKFLGSNALKGLEYPISELYPSGAWAEGFGYFNYIMEYNGWSALSLTNSCGTDYGIVSYPGMLETCNYAIYSQTPGHGYFNFSDGAGIGEAIATPPEVFLFAKLSGNQEINDLWYNFRFNMLGDGQKTLDILFYTPGQTTDSNMDFALDYKFGGINLVAMKNSWTDVSGAQVGTLGGSIMAHEHFHAGHFWFEALGERWSVDLGKDDYNIAGGYYGTAGLDIYRRRAEGHNCLVINPDATPGQKVGGYAYVEKQESKPKAAYAIYNLDENYSENATTAKRGFYFGDDRNTLTVQDEFKLKKGNSDIYWFMHTKAKIEVAPDGKSATLTQNGQTLRIEFASNLKEWHIEAREALPLDTTPIREGQGKNTGIIKVTLVGKGSGDCYITAKLIPVTQRVAYPGVSYVPMNQWTLPDGEIEPLMNVTSIQIDGNTLPGFDPLVTEYKYTTMDATVMPQVSATVTKGNLTVTQASKVGDFAVITLTDGVETLTYRVKIEEGIIDSLAQSDNAYKPADGGLVSAALTTSTWQSAVPDNLKKLKIKGFYALDAQTGNAAEHIFDNDLTTRWASDVDGAYIVADLGEIKKIDGVVAAFYDGKSREYKFDIQVSNDNKNYTTVFSGVSLMSDGLASLGLGVEARYIKFVGYGHTKGEWNNMLEFAPYELK